MGEEVKVKFPSLSPLFLGRLCLPPACGGGAGCYDRADVNIWFDKVVDWVEKGVEPQAIVGSRKDASGKLIRTRPFCPYPEVARYRGTGSIDAAENFTCKNPST